MRKKILTALLLIICIVPGVLINSPGAYVPLAFLLLLGLVSFLYTVVSARFCKLEAEPPELMRYERGSTAHCKIALHNKGILILPCVSMTLAVESKQGLPPMVFENLLMLRPGERLVLELPVEFPHVGQYEIKIPKLRFSGFLGVLSWSVKPRWTAPVHVTPKLYEMPGLNLMTKQGVTSVDFNTPDKISGGEYSDVRLYTPGDPLKNVHWKLSAHSTDYITKLFKTDAVSGVSIYVDFRLPQGAVASLAADINDCAVECAYAAAARALELCYNVEFIYTRGNTPAVSRPKDIFELMTAVYSMPVVSPNERYPTPLLVSEYSGNIMSPDNIIIITAIADKRTADVMADLGRRGKRAILCRVCIDDPDIPLPEIEGDTGLSCYTVGSAREFANAVRM